MKLLTTTILAAAVLAPGVAAANPFYAKVSVGQTDADLSGVNMGDGMAYGAALGTTLGPLRIEGGVDHLAGDFSGVVEAEALDYSATAYADIPLGSRGSLFAGIGADYVDGSASIFSSSVDGDGTGWHWAVGGAYRLSDNVIAEAQFRRVDAELSTDFGDVDLEADVVTVGFRLGL